MNEELIHRDLVYEIFMAIRKRVVFIVSADAIMALWNKKEV
jgi:hypothetical protein